MTSRPAFRSNNNVSKAPGASEIPWLICWKRRGRNSARCHWIWDPFHAPIGAPDDWRSSLRRRLFLASAFYRIAPSFSYFFASQRWTRFGGSLARFPSPPSSPCTDHELDWLSWEIFILMLCNKSLLIRSDLLWITSDDVWNWRGSALRSLIGVVRLELLVTLTLILYYVKPLSYFFEFTPLALITFSRVIFLNG